MSNYDDWQDSLNQLRAIAPPQSERNDWQGNTSPPRRVSMQEERSVTNAPPSAWTPPHAEHARAEIVRASH